MENYLEHHGILGQKWGVRRYQNADGSLTSLGKKRAQSVQNSENKAKNAKTSLGKQYHNYNAATKKGEIERANKVVKADTLGKKISEAYGYGNSATRYKAINEYTTKNAKIAKTRAGRKLNEAQAFNSKQLSKYYEDMNKASIGEKITENILHTKLMSTPYQSLSGRQSTYGKETVIAMFTSGYGNIVLDAKYTHDTKKAAKAEYKAKKAAAKSEWLDAANKYVDSNDDRYDKAADKYNETIKKAKETYKRSY